MAEGFELDAVARLRDVHLPDPVSWWPPAPGWWILAALAVALGYAAHRLIRRRLASPTRAAKAELAAIEAQYRATGDAQLCVANVSTLLRRAALALFPRREVAGLAGRAWLEFLDRSGRTGTFTEGPGAALAQAPYRAASPADTEALLRAAALWLSVQRVGALPRR